MAPSSSSSKSPSSSLPPLSHHQSLPFTPIQECQREEEQEEEEDDNQNSSSSTRPTPADCTDKAAAATTTPLHGEKNGKRNSKKWHGDGGAISCNKCRPSTREKISVVPLDTNNNNNNVKHSYSSSSSAGSLASPNGILRTIFHSFLKGRSPRSPDAAAREEQWKSAAAELSNKLVQATRKRDEAILEASRLKYSMAELEKKLNKLEIYCRELKSGLDECNIINNSPFQGKMVSNGAHQDHHLQYGIKRPFTDSVIGEFLASVSEARSSLRLLSRSLTAQLRHMGTRVFDRISILLQPYEIKIPFSKNPKSVLFYLEALLNKSFFEDFESVGFQKGSANQVLNPVERCEANYASFNVLRTLTWEEVLSKGTKHFSEEFSKFCDRKMNEIVGMLGWNRAWPEPLLQAFFNASKSVWLVHLLANSVHPGLPIFRIDKGVRFDSVYMEDMGSDRARKLVPNLVRIMVAPGFYVHGNVVKCKVMCRYYNHVINDDHKGLNIASP